ncbi:MAG: CGCGG family rSAM-modified RiPP protein [Halanaeroarchaeum sp.]
MASSLDAEADTVTGAFHDNSWSANLEEPRHADDRQAILEEAVSAIERTGSGYHVNLVTHGDQGHPESYLYDPLSDEFGDGITLEYVDQCGCGGHVTKASVVESAGAPHGKD